MLGPGVSQTRVERGDGSAARRVLVGPGHGPRGGPRPGDDHGGAGVGADGEHPVEQRAPAHPYAGLVRAAEPPGGPACEHHGVVAVGAGGP